MIEDSLQISSALVGSIKRGARDVASKGTNHTSWSSLPGNQALSISTMLIRQRQTITLVKKSHPPGVREFTMFYNLAYNRDYIFQGSRE